jgi:hypothetical protein
LPQRLQARHEMADGGITAAVHLQGQFDKAGEIGVGAVL